MAVLSSDREGGVQISEEDGVKKWLTETDNTEGKRERRANERRGWRE